MSSVQEVTNMIFEKCLGKDLRHFAMYNTIMQIQAVENYVDSVWETVCKIRAKLFRKSRLFSIEFPA